MARTRRRLFEQLDGLQQQIVEIERVALFQRVQVVGVDLGDLLVAPVPAGRARHRVRALHPVLRAADSRQRRSRLDEAVVDLQRLQRLLDDRQLIGRVVDDEIARQADRRRLAAQQPRAQRVKRRHPHAGAVGAEQRLDARAHFLRRLVRERDREHFVRLRVAVADEIRDAAGDDARLARAGAGKDQQRTFGVKDRFALLGV